MKYWCDLVCAESIGLVPSRDPKTKMGWCRCCIGGSRQGRDGLSALWRRKGPWVHPAMCSWAWRPWQGDNQHVEQLISRSMDPGKQKSSRLIDCLTAHTWNILFRSLQSLPYSSIKKNLSRWRSVHRRALQKMPSLGASNLWREKWTACVGIGHVGPTSSIFSQNCLKGTCSGKPHMWWL